MLTAQHNRIEHAETLAPLGDAVQVVLATLKQRMDVATTSSPAPPPAADTDTRERRDRFQRTLRLPPRYAQASLTDLIASDGNRTALRAAAAFITAPASCRGIVFSGPPGTGKTHMAAAIGRDLVRCGQTVQWWTVSDWLTALRSRIERGGDTTELLRQTSQTPYLILDDLGQERVTDWVRSTLYELINYRYNYVLPIILTTNKSLDELDTQIGAPIVSRIVGMCDVIAVRDRDARFENIDNF